MSHSIRPLVVSVPTDELAADLGDLPDGVEIVVWPMDGPAPRGAFDIVVPPYMIMARVLARLDGVRVGLVQGQSIGYEGVDRLLPPGLPFANAASVHETSTAELAARADDRLAAAHRPVRACDTTSGVWAPAFAESLADRRVLLLGYGGVGKAVAARLAPVRGRRSPRSRVGRASKTGCRCTASTNCPRCCPRPRSSS